MSKKNKTLSSNAFFKKILHQKPAIQFLETYLPESFKNIVNIKSVLIAPKSYIKPNLKKSFSDIVYKLKTKDQKQAFIYVLLEHQSRSDPTMPLRLWEYMLRLVRNHLNKTGGEELLLTYPVVLYNGASPYNAPRNLWDMFKDPILAKEFLTKDHKLIDLQSEADEGIQKKNHIALLEYTMKHICMRDQKKLLSLLFKDYRPQILLDREMGFLYMRPITWYTSSRLDKSEQKVYKSRCLDRWNKRKRR